MVYVCYDNGAYMNTGIQRSSATPHFADTTTSPAGTKIPDALRLNVRSFPILLCHYMAPCTADGGAAIDLRLPVP